MQRKKLTLLPRSEHPQEPNLTPVASDDAKPKSNPFGTAKPVDTDSALKKVEEKLAKEREHKDELGPQKGNVPSNSSPGSPTAPRHDKGRVHPKQLLRRTSANPPSGPSHSENDVAVAARPEGRDEATSENSETTWRKPDNSANPPPSGEEGWETVPSRSKRVNGVGTRH